MLLYLPLAHNFGRLMHLSGAYVGYAIAFLPDPLQAAAALPAVKPTVFPSVPARLREDPHRRRRQVRRRDGREAEADRLGARRRPPRQRAPARRAAGAARRSLAQHRIADRLVYAKVKARLGGRLRLAISGGAPLSAEIAEFFHAIDILLVEGYGLTECTTAASTNTHEDYRFGTVGRALPGTELKLAEDGELLIRSDTVFQGYYKDPEATAEVLGADGWLRTGDIAEIDADGFVTITDRKKDIIVTAGGKNVAPQNLENDLKTSKYISQAMVVGDRQPYIAALVTLDPEALPAWAAERGLPTDMAGLSRSERGARARPGSRRRRQRRALALRADQALRDPAARLHDGRRRADADAEAEAARRRRAISTRELAELYEGETLNQAAGI